MKYKFEMEKILIIDGTALIFRGFYAIRDLRTANGEPTNAVYGFTSMLMNAIRSERPDFVCFTFDLKGPTFRTVEYKEYKAQRTKAPDELYSQIPKCKEVVKAFEIPIFEKEGFEADDIIATIAKKTEKVGLQTIIFTGDMDMLQLVNQNTFVLAPQNGFKEAKKYGEKEVVEKWGINPAQVPCYKGIRGDTSDNIPGVAGIGEKGAVKLLNDFGTLEGIYENLDKISGSTLEKLKNSRDMAFLSKRLATVKCDVEIDFILENCKTAEFDRLKVETILRELEFQSLLSKLNNIRSRVPVENAKNDEKAGVQQSLF